MMSFDDPIANVSLLIGIAVAFGVMGIAKLSIRQTSRPAVSYIANHARGAVVYDSVEAIIASVEPVFGSTARLRASSRGSRRFKVARYRSRHPSEVPSRTKLVCRFFP